jgi:hypothetical protein
MIKSVATVYNANTKKTTRESFTHFESMAELLAWNAEQEAKKK